MPIRPELLRPRRILSAIAVFLLLGGLGAGIVGAVRADVEPDVSQVAFRLPVPKAGDHGIYVLAAAEGRTLAEAQAATRTRGLAFQWLPDEVVHDANATKQWANVVLINETRSGEPIGVKDLVALRPGSGTVVALLAVDRPRDGAPGANGASQGSGGEATLRRTHLEQGFRGPLAEAVPCGFVPALAFRAHAEGDKVAKAPGCRSAAAVDGDPALILDKVWTAGDVSFALAHDGLGLRHWYRSDVPYAVRIEGMDEAWSLRLASFSRGTQDVRTQPEVLHDSAAPPRLVAAPRTETGPDASGVPHHFPLAAAYGRAKSGSPELRGFLADHPGAYVAKASYRTMVSADEGETWRSWHLVVTDGRFAMDVAVRETERERIPAVPGLLAPQRSYDVSASEPEDAAGEHPLPDQVPAAMPTVASLWAAWQSYASPRYEREQPNQWGYSLRCVRTCADVVEEYEGGFTHYNRTVPSQDPLGLQPMDPIDVEVSSLIQYRVREATGEDLAGPAAYQEDRLDWVRAGQDGAGAPAGFPSPPAQAQALGLFPTAPAAAAIGLGAILAAIAYWLLPVFKAGPAALFSRVRGEALLEHPLRASIHQLIEAEPGIHHRALARALDRSKGSVEHHLRKLTEAGLVTAVAARGHTCYFVGRPPAQAAAVAPLLKSPVARAIVDAVRNQPGIRPADLARGLDVAPTTVHYHLQRLRQANLLTASETGGALRLHAA